jgi:formylglycine-generating enzyme required for sulfatase activity
MDSEMLLSSCGPEGDAARFAKLADELERRGQLNLAATAYDRALGLGDVNAARTRLLDSLAVHEHGMLFRYVPAGSFLMGSADGDPDEQPAHVVQLSEFWISETPISWAAYCHLMGWQAPPAGCPIQPPEPRNVVRKFIRRLFGRRTEEPPKFRADFFALHQENKIRLQYCEDKTTRACDWHAHEPDQVWTNSDGRKTTSREVFGRVPREDGSLPWAYNQKPMVAVSWQEAEELCATLSNEKVTYRLPTEAEWEKAARGGLIGAPYPWGHTPPNTACCDYGRFDDFAIQPCRRFQPNCYGLYAMSGCVWEWTADWYDAEQYNHSARRDPLGPPTGKEKVVRGGSWADCASAVSVSFRASRTAGHWRDGGWAGHMTANIGFRIARVAKQPERQG